MITNKINVNINYILFTRDQNNISVNLKNKEEK